MTTQAEKDAILAELNAADGHLTTVEPLVAPYTSIAADVASAQAAIASAVLETEALPADPPMPGLDPTAFTSDYEGGNGTGFTQLSPTSFRADCEPDPVQNWTMPYDFTITRGCAGKVLTLSIRYKWGTAFIYHKEKPETWHPMLSQDGGVTWQIIPGHTWDAVNQILTFTTPMLVGDALRVTYEAPPYTTLDYATDLAAWQATGFCTVTQIGTSVQGRPINRLTITDPGTPDTGKKALAMYLSGHVDERFACWRVRGMVDWACGPSPEAATFRAGRILHVVLVPNPDASVAGWMRVNAAGVHMNRWNVGPPSLSAEGPEQYAIHADAEALMAGPNPLRLFIDHHTSPQAGDYLTYSPGSSALASLPLATYDPTARINRSITQDGTWIIGAFSHRAMKSRFPALPTMLYENGANFHANGELATWVNSQAVGVSFLRACDAWLVSH